MLANLLPSLLPTDHLKIVPPQAATAAGLADLRPRPLQGRVPPAHLEALGVGEPCEEAAGGEGRGAGEFEEADEGFGGGEGEVAGEGEGVGGAEGGEGQEEGGRGGGTGGGL